MSFRGVKALMLDAFEETFDINAINRAFIAVSSHFHPGHNLISLPAFLEMLVRVARIGRPSLDETMFPKIMSKFLSQAHSRGRSTSAWQFRRKFLYFEEVDNVFKKHARKLRDVYLNYCGRGRTSLENGYNGLSFEDLACLFHDAGLLNQKSPHDCKRLCHFVAQSKQQMLNCKFISFVEYFEILGRFSYDLLSGEGEHQFLDNLKLNLEVISSLGTSSSSILSRAGRNAAARRSMHSVQQIALKR